MIVLEVSQLSKQTLISLLAGLIEADIGGVLFHNKEHDQPCDDIGVVFQSYSLMPWLSVEENIALAVNTVCSDQSRKARKEIVGHYIELVGLSHARTRKPAELSGGMRQRVALARALAIKPEVLLLDEPLSALDALTRSRLQGELATICEKEQCTIVLITNDVDEALLLADRVIPMTPAPSATLANAFPVPHARPRDRHAMNSDKSVIELRASIIKTLMAMNNTSEAEQQNSLVAPKVVPITQSVSPPKVVQQVSAESRKARFLEFSQIEKVYPTPEGPLSVVKDFDLCLEKGEFVTLIGHSGCGKSRA